MSKTGAAQEPSMDEILASIRRIIESSDERGPPRSANAGGAREQRRASERDPLDEAASTAIARLVAEADGGSTPPSRASEMEARATAHWSANDAATAGGTEKDDPSGAAGEIGDSPEDGPAEHWSQESYADLARALETELAADTIESSTDRDVDDQTVDDEEHAGHDASGGEPAARSAAGPQHVAASFLPESTSPKSYTFDDEAASSLHASFRYQQRGDAEPMVLDVPEGFAVRRREETGERPPSVPVASVTQGSSPMSADNDGFARSRSEPADARRMDRNGERADHPHLLSDQAGDLVGASFGELTRAIREGELRSLEDMAQEMLRPMLHEWLDDNLPKLVERLVREEIERVSRGNRR